MSIKSLTKKLTRKVVTLPKLTEAAKASGDWTEEGDVKITIRKVTMDEVTALTGVMPGIFNLRQKLLDEGLKGQELATALQSAITTDDDMLQASNKHQLLTKRAVISLGVVSETVKLKAEYPDDMTPEDFGDDFDHLYNAIIDFSSLPFVRGGAGANNFLASGNDKAESDGGALQETAN